MDDSINEDKDSITLRGCGFITKWNFPQHLTNCPVNKCLKKFGSRSKAIAHYKSTHANDSIYCYLCDKPIAARLRGTYRLHYNRLHPNVKNPFQHLHEHRNAPYSVTLRGCGISTHWNFPITKRCPVMKCSLLFDNRLAALNHYKIKHAPNAILCTICNKPIGASTFKALKLHFRKKHPKKPIPFKLSKHRSICETSLKTEEVY